MYLFPHGEIYLDLGVAALVSDFLYVNAVSLMSILPKMAGKA